MNKIKLYFLLIIIGICLVGLGCNMASENNLEDNQSSSIQSSSSESTNIETESPKVEKESPKHVAIEGCIILKEDDMTLTYYKKCEKCGKTQPGKTTRGSHFYNSNSSFRCINCGNQQKVKIERVN